MRHLLPPIFGEGKQRIHTGDPIEIVGHPTERGGLPVPEKGQFPLGKRGAKATQNGNYDLVHPFQNQYTHEIMFFKLVKGLQLQFSGVSRINLHYSYSFLVVFFAERSYRKEFPSGMFKNLLQLQLHDLMVFEFKM